MSEPIVLQNQSSTGQKLEAVFQPEKGMNLLSYKLGNQEVIDQGIGFLTGPHFMQRKPSVIPPLKPDKTFWQIPLLDELGYHDPFTGGIGSYAPWKVLFSSSTEIKAILSGKDTWEGETLASLEGQNFIMEFHATLNPNGLALKLSVVSDSDSIVGINYHFALPNGQGKVISDVKPQFYDRDILKTIPTEWQRDSQGILTFDLTHNADYSFFPFFDPLSAKITLQTSQYQLITTYSSLCQENSWELYHPQGASYVCISPLSSQNPWKPNLTASSIAIRLEIKEEI